MFEALDRPALRPLPREAYEFATWINKRNVPFTYHIQIERHHYSVPYQYLGRYVRARVGAQIVEIFYGETRIAAHPRGWASERYTTNPAHMPKNHQAYGAWPPSRFVKWAKKIGPYTTALIEENFARAHVPEQVYRRCMGILKLGGEFGHTALERACQLALKRGHLSTAAVKPLVKRIAAEHHQAPAPPIEHENIRGADYYLPNETIECSYIRPS